LSRRSINSATKLVLPAPEGAEIINKVPKVIIKLNIRLRIARLSELD
jgi:hypothetical protein